MTTVMMVLTILVRVVPVEDARDAFCFHDASVTSRRDFLNGRPDEDGDVGSPVFRKVHHVTLHDVDGLVPRLRICDSNR